MTTRATEMSEHEPQLSTAHRPGTVRRLTCSCCGEDAGRWAQFHNMDTGFGACLRCITWMQTRGETRDELERHYGREGVNWGLQVQVYDRSFGITAAFREHEHAAANAWMELHPGEALLTTRDGLLLLARADDKGGKIPPAQLKSTDAYGVPVVEVTESNNPGTTI